MCMLYVSLEADAVVLNVTKSDTGATVLQFSLYIHGNHRNNHGSSLVDGRL